MAGASLTAFDVEQSDDGTIKLLAYREAGEVTKTITETISKRVKVGRKYKYVDQEISREVTEFAEAGFVLTTFDSSGNLIQETTALNPADAATYEAEKLFGIDLNGDSKQGRNIQEISVSGYLGPEPALCVAALSVAPGLEPQQLGCGTDGMDTFAVSGQRCG